MSPLVLARATLDDQVTAVLDGALEDAIARASVYGPRFVLLWREIARSVRGGKRFRSGLVLGAHAGLGGGHPEAAVAVAGAFEVLHTAFLVHDDLIDGDTMRRGEPNLGETMRGDATGDGLSVSGSHRWSAASAVLGGDLALALAHRLVAGVDAPADVRRALTDLLDETMLVSAAGELLDTACGLGLDVPTMEEAVRVAESKTAMYSFRAPLRAGAVLGGADAATLAELDHHGRLLGRAFQQVDDLLGVFAPESETGKSNVSDLREGKRTPLILHAARLPVWAELVVDLGRHDLDEDTAARMRRALASSAAPSLVEQAVSADLDGVMTLLALGGLPAGLAQVVQEISERIRAALDVVSGHIEEARCQAG